HRFGFMDHLAAMASLYATLLAIHRRDLSGEGQAVAASLLGAGVLSAGEVIEVEGALTPLETLNGDQTGVSAQHGIYQCADGWIAIAALAEGEPERLRRLAGAQAREEL